MQLLPGTPGPIENYQKFLEDVVKPRIESVPGVAVVNINASAPEELQVRFDPHRAAELGIEIPAVAAVAGTANDTSGGYVEVGRRDYALALRWPLFAARSRRADPGRGAMAARCRLRDVADIQVRRGDRQNLLCLAGAPGRHPQDGTRVGDHQGKW